MKTIRNVSQLREALAEGRRHFRVCLRWGLYSSKTITPCKDGRFHIVNHIDDVEATMTAEELYSHSNIGDAMRMGAFVAEAPEDYQSNNTNHGN